jgi:UDP-N-acetylglucosamine--N-acetylmuramyl-(pentapeptide) pyrophosphoryl-undecaprenol N-acetylglucosamine transferase
VYPALTVLAQLNVEHPDVQTLWVGKEGGMEADLVTKAGVDFGTIPAAGIHGVGLRRLFGNSIQLLRGAVAARRMIKRFKPDILFFTGGYVAVPMAVAGLRIPSVLYVPDIEPGLALKFLAYFADKIALTAEDSKVYFSDRKSMKVTGYPIRPGLSNWTMKEAYKVFDLNPKLPTLLVTGGSQGSLTINQALVEVLPELLSEMQIIHITGDLTWDKFSNIAPGLPSEISPRYRSYPYLHEEMGAALKVADLVISRAGASSIGEYPHFGIPAILVPYPHAWRYQKVNANYLTRHKGAIILKDEDLHSRLGPVVQELMRSPERRNAMKAAMRSLAGQDAGRTIANLIYETAALKGPARI